MSGKNWLLKIKKDAQPESNDLIIGEYDRFITEQLADTEQLVSFLQGLEDDSSWDRRADSDLWTKLPKREDSIHAVKLVKSLVIDKTKQNEKSLELKVLELVGEISGNLLTMGATMRFMVMVDFLTLVSVVNAVFVWDSSRNKVYRHRDGRLRNVVQCACTLLLMMYTLIFSCLYLIFASLSTEFGACRPLRRPKLFTGLISSRACFLWMDRKCFNWLKGSHDGCVLCCSQLRASPHYRDFDESLSYTWIWPSCANESPIYYHQRFGHLRPGTVERRALMTHTLRNWRDPPCPNVLPNMRKGELNPCFSDEERHCWCAYADPYESPRNSLHCSSGSYNYLPYPIMSPWPWLLDLPANT